MRKTLFFALVLLSGVAFSQQRPQYSQYMVNPFVLNPAVAGVENYADIKAGYRNQWVNFDGHPVTYYLSAHMPIGKAMCVNPRIRHKKPGYHGVGGYVMGDVTGPSNRYSGYLSYAYHLRLGKNLFASLGLSGGIQSYFLNGDLLDISRRNESLKQWAGADAAGMGKRLNVPDFSAGTWIYSGDFFVGASISQILAPKLEFDFLGQNPHGDAGRLQHHYFIIGGYNIKVDNDLSIIPSVALKGVQPSPLTFDINCKARYKDMYWAGLSYRRGDAIAAMAGIVLMEAFEVSYSYDITMSEIRKYSNGVHEIVVGYRLPLKQNLVCPSHFW
jgi:type IX secretion system PorP/SprF family membrane protein